MNGGRNMEDVKEDEYKIEHPIYHEARRVGTTSFEYDENGNVVLDKNGEPVRKVVSKGVWKTLVLRPSEYYEIRSRCNRKYQIIFDLLLYTGMRYEELVRLKNHKEWIDFKNKRIYLPGGEGQKKVKRRSVSRVIRLSNQGVKALEGLFDVELPSKAVVDQYIYRKFRNIVPLQKIEVNGKTYYNHPFSLKTFRKTWESWLLYYYEGRESFIAQSQGHTVDIQFKDYFAGSLSEKDKIDMKPYVEGWL